MAAKSKSRNGKNTQKGNVPADVGFLPCFARYLSDKYPIDTAYQNKTFIDKLGTFLSIILTTPNPQQLRMNGACHKTILIKPNDAESRRIISDCASPESKIYRAGFGDNTMRIIFGLEHRSRMCYIFALDANHDTFNGKNKG
jgi:hypothetical protein